MRPVPPDLLTEVDDPRIEVWCCIAIAVDKNGPLTASLPEMVELTEVPRATLARALRFLEGGGWITRVRHLDPGGGVGNTATTYGLPEDSAPQRGVTPPTGPISGETAYKRRNRQAIERGFTSLFHERQVRKQTAAVMSQIEKAGMTVKDIQKAWTSSFG